MRPWERFWPLLSRAYLPQVFPGSPCFSFYARSILLPNPWRSAHHHAHVAILSKDYSCLFRESAPSSPLITARQPPDLILQQLHNVERSLLAYYEGFCSTMENYP